MAVRRGQTGEGETLLALDLPHGDVDRLLYEVLGGEDCLEPDQDRGVPPPDRELLGERHSGAGYVWRELWEIDMIIVTITVCILHSCGSGGECC